MTPLTPEQAQQISQDLMAQAQADRDARTDALAPTLPWLLRTPALMALPARERRAVVGAAQRTMQFRLEMALALVAAVLAGWWLVRQGSVLWLAAVALLWPVRHVLARRAVNRLLRP